jgi:hypothetical protein
MFGLYRPHYLAFVAERPSDCQICREMFMQVDNELSCFFLNEVSSDAQLKALRRLLCKIFRLDLPTVRACLFGHRPCFENCSHFYH